MLRRLQGLGHPAFTGAVFVLAVNDHVLKIRFPGTLTGKVSDVAGVFVVAAALNVVTGRRSFAILGTATAFTVIKLWAPAASFVSPLLGGTPRQDPTDLIALIALWPAARFGARFARPVETWSRDFLVVLSGVCVVVAATATSCDRPDAVDRLAVSPSGRVLAAIAIGFPYGGEDSLRWAESLDGGQTWMASAGASQLPPDTQETCAGRICFRIVGARSIEQSLQGGPWTRSFAFSPEQERRMGLRSGCGIVSSVDLRSIISVGRADGDHVVVAAGAQGVIHRRPEGTWERRAVLDSVPLSLHGPSWLFELEWSPLAVAAWGVFLAVVPRRRSAWSRKDVGALIAGAGGGVLLSVVGLAAMAPADYVVVGPAVAVASFVIFVISLVVARSEPPARPPHGVAPPAPGTSSGES